MRAVRLLFMTSLAASAALADFCNPVDFQGAYGFQLTGTTTIGSHPQPVVTVGRLVFAGDGTVAGVSSVSFTGLYLGNPVAGKYEARTDCSVSWSLQDDSGNFQHFQGTMTKDARRVEFHQTDPGAPSQGAMVKSSLACQEQDLRARYRFRLSGKEINVDTAQVSGEVSASGVMENNGGQLTLTLSADSASPGNGTLEVEDDCFVQLHFNLALVGDQKADMNFRGILVDGGSELLGLATDPGTAVSLRLTAP